MGDRWGVANSGVLTFDGEWKPVDVVAGALGMGVREFMEVLAEQRNADPRTNPPKVGMVPWAEVDTRPGKHLPADGTRWSDFRTHHRDPSLIALNDYGVTHRYEPGSSVPVRSSDGEA